MAVSTNNKRKEIRDKVKELLVASAPLSGFTIQNNRMLGIPPEKLPAIIIFNGDELWTETVDRSGYQVDGNLLVRVVSKGKLPPEILGTGEKFADDELDEIGTLVENVLIGPRFFLGGVTDIFRIADQTFGFSEDKETESLFFLTIKFFYKYQVAFPV